MNKQEPVFAFDLHGVIFRLDWRRIVKLFWHYDHKLRLILCCFDPRFAWHGFWIVLQHPTDEEVYALFERYCPTVLPFIIECTNAQKPILPMVALLRDLKAKGYKIHAVSNCGPRRFKVLQERFNDIIALFDYVHITNGIVGAMIKKPQAQFFDAYIKASGVEASAICFIDDSKSNGKAAQQAGIQFIRYKNPQQIIDELKRREL